MTEEQVAVQLKDQDDRLKVVEAGVSNFRKFQLSTTRKIGFVYGATWVAGIVGMALLVILSWALSLIVPAAKAVVKDYYQTHPNAQILRKSAIVAPPDPNIGEIAIPEEAGNDPHMR